MAKRTKNTAMVKVPPNRDEVVQQIVSIGDLQGRVAVVKAQHDESAREIGRSFDGNAAPRADELKNWTAGVQAYCEAHRDELTNGGKVKFTSSSRGTVSRRTRPPRVTLRKTEAIIEACNIQGFDSFIRVKEEINKDAMLREPYKAMSIAGVTIKSPGEDFIIEPLELKKGAA